jgi:hypothetical protein
MSSARQANDDTRVSDAAGMADDAGEAARVVIID